MVWLSTSGWTTRPQEHLWRNTLACGLCLSTCPKVGTVHSACQSHCTALHWPDLSTQFCNLQIVTVYRYTYM